MLPPYGNVVMHAMSKHANGTFVRANEVTFHIVELSYDAIKHGIMTISRESTRLSLFAALRVLTFEADAP